LSSDELDRAVEQILKENPNAVADYKAGREQSLMFLLGSVQKKFKGKAPVQDVLTSLKKRMS
jgi:aspartyl-tRNA(Asn)/glutamyl-tRNA(Gln) amidotransferase subunit B